jgi:hypothetical protein
VFGTFSSFGLAVLELRPTFGTLNLPFF